MALELGLRVVEDALIFLRRVRLPRLENDGLRRCTATSSAGIRRGGTILITRRKRDFDLTIEVLDVVFEGVEVEGVEGGVDRPCVVLQVLLPSVALVAALANALHEVGVGGRDLALELALASECGAIALLLRASLQFGEAFLRSGHSAANGGINGLTRDDGGSALDVVRHLVLEVVGEGRNGFLRPLRSLQRLQLLTRRRKFIAGLLQPTSLDPLGLKFLLRLFIEGLVVRLSTAVTTCPGVVAADGSKYVLLVVHVLSLFLSSPTATSGV